MRRQFSQDVAQLEESSPRKGDVVGSNPTILTIHAGVAQRAEAAVSEAVQCGFESLLRYQVSLRSVRSRRRERSSRTALSGRFAQEPTPKIQVAVAQVEELRSANAGAEVRLLPAAPIQAREEKRETRRVGRTGMAPVSKTEVSPRGESGFESLALRQTFRGGETGSHAGLLSRCPRA